METQEEAVVKVILNKIMLLMPMLAVIGMILPRRAALKRGILLHTVIGRRTKKR